jgi:hypothetical protein
VLCRHSTSPPPSPPRRHVGWQRSFAADAASAGMRATMSRLKHAHAFSNGIVALVCTPETLVHATKEHQARRSRLAYSVKKQIRISQLQFNRNCISVLNINAQHLCAARNLACVLLHHPGTCDCEPAHGGLKNKPQGPGRVPRFCCVKTSSSLQLCEAKTSRTERTHTMFC